MPYYQPGDIVLRDYKIEAFIGEGGFGEVYRALDIHLQQSYALKIIRHSPGMDDAYFEKARQRFMLEARLGARLNHPNLIRAVRFAPEETSGLLVLVMEYASGGSLADKIKSDPPLQVSESLQIARQVAAGLSALHAQDVVHRDLKPSNILFDANGVARVADLGLAQPASAVHVGESSSGGGGEFHTSPGTPAYMSPEQEIGKPYLPPSSDIYALGLILFEMLAGRSYKNQPQGTRLSQLRSDIPAALDDLVSKMLSDDPRQRPWDGAAAERALEGISEMSVLTVVSTAPSQSPKWTLEDGLSAIKVMIAEQEWHTADGLLKQLEAAYPSNPILYLSRKQIDQALGMSRQAESQITQRKTGEETSRGTAEQARLTELGRNKMPAALKAKQMVGERIPHKAEIKVGREALTDSVSSRANSRPKILGWVITFIILSGLGLLIVYSSVLLNWMVPTSVDTATVTPTYILPPCTKIGQTWTSPVDGMTLACVPAGDFLMGSIDADIESFDDEKPQHKVYLDAYWIDQTEITNAMYMHCVADGACREPGSNGSNTRDSYYGNDQYADYPVINIYWRDAHNYCTWAGRQLPSEAQWEKAARGTDGRLYPWGDELPNSILLNYNNNINDTTKIGSYPAGASLYGALDMAGNVWEWVADRYDANYYSSKTTWINPTGPAYGDNTVARGGSWRSDFGNVRIAMRLGEDRYDRFNYLGFRCLFSVTP